MSQPPRNDFLNFKIVNFRIKLSSSIDCRLSDLSLVNHSNKEDNTLRNYVRFQQHPIWITLVSDKNFGITVLPRFSYIHVSDTTLSNNTASRLIPVPTLVCL